MANRFKFFLCVTAASIGALSGSQAQTSSPAPLPTSGSAEVQPASSTDAKVASPASATAAVAKTGDSSLMLVQAAPAAPTNAGKGSSSPASAPVEPDSVADNGGVGVREFQGDDVGQVLRLLARQAKINMVVSDQLPPNSTVTMRLEDVTALQAIAIIVKAKGLFMDNIDNVYYVKTPAERTAEPTESDNYQFSYSRAKDIQPLLDGQLASKDKAQFDERTNTIFFRETRSNIDNVRKFLAQIDKPTKQVMIEARLVEVNANPKQAYGINWGGVLGGATNPQTLRFRQATVEEPRPQPSTPMARLLPFQGHSARQI